jgi:ASPIC and UnbV
VRFGLGDATTVQKVTVRWPRGGDSPTRIQSVTPAGIDRIIEVREPK